MRISTIGAALVGLALLMPATGRCGITLLNDFDGNGVTQGNGGAIFRQPGFSGSTGGNLDITTYNSTAISTDQAFSGTKALRVQMQFKDDATTRWDRLTTSGADPVIDAGGVLSMMVRIESADPTRVAGPLGFALGVREVTYASDPAIGSKGTGTSTGLEFIGTSGTPTPDPIRNVAVGGWQQLVFNLPAEPIQSFVGNGVLNPTFGKVNLEQLAIRSRGNSAPVNIYIDDIQVRSLDTVPEPGTMALLATGLLPLLGLRRRTR
jgi:hypothetical protein